MSRNTRQHDRDDRRPRDAKRTPRAKQQTLDRRRQRAAKRARQGR